MENGKQEYQEYFMGPITKVDFELIAEYKNNYTVIAKINGIETHVRLSPETGRMIWRPCLQTPEQEREYFISVKASIKEDIRTGGDWDLERLRIAYPCLTVEEQDKINLLFPSTQNQIILDNPEYEFFLVNVTKNFIDSGWSYKDDALELQRDYKLWCKDDRRVWTRAYTTRFFNKGDK